GEQRVLVPRDLVAQRALERVEILERRVQPAAVAKKFLFVAHVVGGAVDDVGRQLAQLGGERGGEAQVGLAVRALDGDLQDGGGADALRQPLQLRHRRIARRQELGEVGAQLEARRQRGGRGGEGERDRE